MFSASKLAATLIFAILPLTFTSVFANPIAARATCKPNFEGNRESIYVGTAGGLVDEWAPTDAFGTRIKLVQKSSSAAFATGEFLVAFSGQPSGTYQVRLVSDTQRQFALTAGTGGQLTFAINGPTPQPDQVWNIDCNTCPVPGSGQTSGLRAGGCTISNPSKGTCVTGNQNGQILQLLPCDGSAKQTYSFYSGN